jgi:hypothetical protein
MGHSDSDDDKKKKKKKGKKDKKDKGGKSVEGHIKHRREAIQRSAKDFKRAPQLGFHFVHGDPLGRTDPFRLEVDGSNMTTKADEATIMAYNIAKRQQTDLQKLKAHAEATGRHFGQLQENDLTAATQRADLAFQQFTSEEKVAILTKQAERQEEENRAASRQRQMEHERREAERRNTEARQEWAHAQRIAPEIRAAEDYEGFSRDIHRGMQRQAEFGARAQEKADQALNFQANYERAEQWARENNVDGFPVTQTISPRLREVIIQGPFGFRETRDMHGRPGFYGADHKNPAWAVAVDGGRTRRGSLDNIFRAPPPPLRERSFADKRGDPFDTSRDPWPRTDTAASARQSSSSGSSGSSDDGGIPKNVHFLPNGGPPVSIGPADAFIDGPNEGRFMEGGRQIYQVVRVPRAAMPPFSRDGMPATETPYQTRARVQSSLAGISTGTWAVSPMFNPQPAGTGFGGHFGGGQRAGAMVDSTSGPRRQGFTTKPPFLDFPIAQPEDSLPRTGQGIEGGFQTAMVVPEPPLRFSDAVATRGSPWIPQDGPLIDEVVKKDREEREKRRAGRTVEWIDPRRVKVVDPEKGREKRWRNPDDPDGTKAKIVTRKDEPAFARLAANPGEEPEREAEDPLNPDTSETNLWGEYPLPSSQGAPDGSWRSSDGKIHLPSEPLAGDGPPLAAAVRPWGTTPDPPPMGTLKEKKPWPPAPAKPPMGVIPARTAIEMEEKRREDLRQPGEVRNRAELVESYRIERARYGAMSDGELLAQADDSMKKLAVKLNITVLDLMKRYKVEGRPPIFPLKPYEEGYYLWSPRKGDVRV